MSIEKAGFSQNIGTEQGYQRHIIFYFVTKTTRNKTIP